MSEERLDRIEKQVEQLVGAVGSLATAVADLTEQQKAFAEQQKQFDGQIKSLAEQQNKTGEQIKALAEQQRITGGQLADVARVVIETKSQQDEFREETRENFDKLHKEMRVTNRKVDWSSTTALDAQKRVEDLEARVRRLEEKAAA